MVEWGDRRTLAVFSQGVLIGLGFRAGGRRVSAGKREVGVRAGSDPVGLPVTRGRAIAREA